MVSLDDNSTLLEMVRHCFLTGDDSRFMETLLDRPTHGYSVSSVLDGKYCEPIIDTEAGNFARLSPEIPFVDCEDPLSALSVSSDLSPNEFDFGEKSSASTCRTLNTLTAAEIDRFFPLQSTSPDAQTSLGSKKSRLTLALEQAKADGRLLRNNLFSDYSIHDGRSIGSDSRLTVRDNGPRRFTVWFWRISGLPRISICVQPNWNTTVRQFIGLVFWQYFNETSTDQEPLLSEDLKRFDESFVDRISVYMFETPDEMDESCFPPFDPSDPIHKYEFDALALVEQAVPTEIPKVLVTIHLPYGTSRYRFHVNTQLSAVMEHAMRRRQLRQLGGYQYHLESLPVSVDRGGLVTGEDQFRQGQKLDLNLRLGDVLEAKLPLRFIMVRENSRCDPSMVESSDDECSPATDYSTAARLWSTQCDAALKLRQYSVTFLKGLYSRDVQLNVSSDGIKVEQSSNLRRRKLFSKFKTITYSVHALADCEVDIPKNSAASGEPFPKTAASSHDERPAKTSACPSYVSKKVQLKIIYLTQPDGTLVDTTTSGGPSLPGVPGTLDTVPSFQQLCFETQWSRARAICDQLHLILEYCGSRARQLYLRQRLAL